MLVGKKWESDVTETEGTLEDRLSALLSKQEAMEEELDRLRSKQEIAEVIYKGSRASDRGDVELAESIFHPDGTDYRGVANGPAENTRNALRYWNADMAHHVVTNILVEFESKDVAKVESYCTATHYVSAENDGKGRDEHIKTRYLDRFERRDGVWKIARRITIWEYTRVALPTQSWEEVVTGPGVTDKRFLKGTRDKSDLSYTFELPEQFRSYEPDYRP
jgi:SnoaL-like domain